MRYVFILLALSAQLFAVTNRIEIIIITPPEVLLSPGQTVQMHAYGYYSDGTVTDFTSKVTWSSVQSSIATVSSTGLVTMKGAGSALIKAAYSGYKGYGTVWNKFTPFIRVKPSTASFGKIEHIVYIVKENRSFDSYFGTFPGANGATSGTISTGQVVTLGHLPDPPTHDMGHEWTDNHGNIDGGRMDRFDLELTCSVNGDMACMDQLYQSDIPNYWSYAQSYGLADAAFSSVSSGSYPAHLAMISGSAQRVLDNPRSTQPAQWEQPCRSCRRTRRWLPSFRASAPPRLGTLQMRQEYRGRRTRCCRRRVAISTIRFAVSVRFSMAVIGRRR